MSNTAVEVVDEAALQGNLETKENVNSKTEELEIMKEVILTHLSNYTGDIFFKSQQRDDPPLTPDEKKEIARSLLDSSPSNFLARFGKVLGPSHLSYFHQYKDTYEVKFYLEHLEKTLVTGTINMKNQRFHAMNELIKQGKYFSMSEMKKRNPVHFYHLVEKYMTDEERRALDQDQPKMCNLSTIFMAHIDGDATISKRKSEQLIDQSTWDQYNALDGDEEEEEEEEDDDVEADQQEQEKKFFLEEFISSMHRSFLEGRDEDFDYSQIEQLNSGADVISERDAEERYFDSD